VIVDCAIYVDGVRRREVAEVDDALREARAKGGFVWIGVVDPSPEEFDSIATAFDLHPLAVEDAVHAHQRPKLETYDDSVFVVLKPARYVDREEIVQIGQVMVFLGDGFVVTVRHGESRLLASVRQELDRDPGLLQWGPTSVLYAVADRVVDSYATVTGGLEVDIDEIEQEVFSGPRTSHAERIFRLKRELLEFRRAVDPLAGPLEQLASNATPVDKAAAHYFRDVHDHTLRVGERLAALDALLDSALQANVAQLSVRQNEDMRKISAWVAIVAVPTMIAGIYGMNFDHMPELHSRFGYPIALVAMVIACLVLYRSFKRRGWL